MDEDGLVSIIIPTYYREARLKTAIESAENQSYGNVEIIVVDDSGERFAEDIVNEFDVTYVYHDENRGGNAARNTGISESSGEYVQLLDDDDVIRPQKIAKQVEVLGSSVETGVVYGGIQDRSGRKVKPKHQGDVLKWALAISLPASYTSSLLIERDVIEEILPLTNREAADDIGMKIELARISDFEYVDEVLTEIGTSPRHRSASISFPEELQNILNEYRYLYERYPPCVHRRVLMTMHRRRGYAILDEKIWSLSAAVSFGKAVYYGEGIDLYLVGLFFSSLLGQFGLAATAKVNTMLFHNT